MVYFLVILFLVIASFSSLFYLAKTDTLVVFDNKKDCVLNAMPVGLIFLGALTYLSSFISSSGWLFEHSQLLQGIAVFLLILSPLSAIISIVQTMGANTINPGLEVVLGVAKIIVASVLVLGYLMIGDDDDGFSITNILLTLLFFGFIVWLLKIMVNGDRVRAKQLAAA